MLLAAERLGQDGKDRLSSLCRRLVLAAVAQRRGASQGTFKPIDGSALAVQGNKFRDNDQEGRR